MFSRGLFNWETALVSHKIKISNSDTIHLDVGNSHLQMPLRTIPRVKTIDPLTNLTRVSAEPQLQALILPSWTSAPGVAAVSGIASVELGEAVGVEQQGNRLPRS